MKDVLRSEKVLSAPNGIKITIWTDGTGKYLSVGVIYKALGYDGRFNHTTLLAMVFKNHSFALMRKVLPTAAQYVCLLDQIVPILQSFIRPTLMTTNSKSHYVRNAQDIARIEAQRLIEMFNTEVFGKPSSVTVKTIDQPDETLFDETTEQVTTLEVPATKEINVEVENTAETTAPPPEVKSLLEQLANQTGVDKAIIANAILNDRQSKFDSEQKKLRDLLN